MQACDISTTLDASREVPIIEGWPITKVTVFLVDSKKENCSLLFSSITQGVWSVIEKDVQISHQILGSTMETNQTYKRKRVIQKSSRVDSRIDLTDYQQLAYLAVKEATGMLFPFFIQQYSSLDYMEKLSSSTLDSFVD